MAVEASQTVKLFLGPKCGGTTIDSNDVPHFQWLSGLSHFGLGVGIDILHSPP